MRTYARVSDEELVHELFSTDGNMADMFAPEMIWVDVTDMVPMPQPGWSAVKQPDDSWVFAPPVPWAPSPEQILASNTYLRDFFLSAATLAIGPLQDAVDLDMATPEEVALLKKWKLYRVAINRIDLTVALPAWPDAPA
jgi:hypothetical protein